MATVAFAPAPRAVALSQGSLGARPAATSAGSEMSRSRKSTMMSNLGENDEEEQELWFDVLDRYLVRPGVCCAAAAGSLADAEVALCTAVPDWDHVYQEARMEEITQPDDVSTEWVTVEELQCLQAALSGERTWLWIAGERYIVNYLKDERVREQEIKMMFANRPRKGVWLAAVKNLVYYAIYDEEVPGQNAFQLRKAMLKLAVHIVDNCWV
mmetsp:Transcript_23802/g.68567  ORF Transcript_23802/g.68567 Transcript_23802/m.68567 type:complete len:212 (-) Transcript_23802:133-768(-)